MEKTDALKSPVEPALPVRNFASTLLALLALIVLLRYAQELCVPVVVGVLIAYALNPFVALLENCRLHRAIASMLVVIALFGGVAACGYALRQQVTAVLDSVPAAIAKIRSEIQLHGRGSGRPETSIAKIQEAANEIAKTATAASQTDQPSDVPKVQVEQPPFRVIDFIWTGSLSLLGVFSDAVLIIFLVFFLLISGDLFKRKVVHLVGTGFSDKKLTVATLNTINAQIERFILIQVMTSAAVGCCIACGAWLFGLHQPAFWGVLAAFLCSIPYVGPIFVGLALMSAAFVQFDSMEAALKIAVIPLIVFVVEGFLVKPAVMGKAARINGVAMFLGLLFWSWIWGLIGLIVAVPIMMVIKTVCENVESLVPIAEILDEN